MKKTILANRYRVIGKLGRGGMGTVYLAKDKKLNMKWAVKEIGRSSDFVNYTRKSEVSVLRKVSHPNLPRVTDIFDESGKTYMVMDYIEGRSLQEILDTKKKIPPKKYYRWALEIISALQYLHSMNPPVIYRDLKPSNIMIRPSGAAVLIDFGCAKKYEEAGDEYALGSKGYAAPEQYKGISDKRSDIYAFGRLLSEMTTASSTFILKHIIRKCCQNDPERRYPGAEAVKHALIVSRDIYKYVLALMTVMIAVSTGIYMSGQNARDSVRQIEEINESERSRSFYEDGLMCFYELKDYPSALEYFKKADEGGIPEAGYYIGLCKALSVPGQDMRGLFELLEEFEEFNESSLKEAEPLRKAKNDLNIAELYLTYADDDIKKLKKAESILRSADTSYEAVRIKALTLLEGVYREMGRLLDSRESYLMAVKCNEELISSDKAIEDDDFIIRRYLNNARLCEGMKMYKKADEYYRQCKESYPLQGEDIYIGHLHLLLYCHADREDILEAYRQACRIKGITENREFIKLKERMDNE